MRSAERLQLRWEDAGAARIARRLEEAGLPVRAIPGEHGGDTWWLALAAAELAFAPPPAADTPGGDHRPLRVVGSIAPLLFSAGRPGPRPGRSPVRPDLAGLGWATVDLEGAADRLGLVGRAGPATREDALLGARAIVAGRLVLLEPTREGRLAASLARFGEGPVAVYLAVAGPGPEESEADAGEADAAAAGGGEAAASAWAGRSGRSALGPATLLGGPSWGPHLLLVGARQPRSPAAGTIST